MCPGVLYAKLAKLYYTIILTVSELCNLCNFIHTSDSFPKHRLRQACLLKLYSCSQYLIYMLANTTAAQTNIGQYYKILEQDYTVHIA